MYSSLEEQSQVYVNFSQVMYSLENFQPWLNAFWSDFSKELAVEGLLMQKKQTKKNFFFFFFCSLWIKCMWTMVISLKL